MVWLLLSSQFQAYLGRNACAAVFPNCSVLRRSGRSYRCRGLGSRGLGVAGHRRSIFSFAAGQGRRRPCCSAWPWSVQEEAEMEAWPAGPTL